MPMVSVIMPCFNHGRFLRDSIEGVLYQEYSDLELIIVDDHSTDDTRDIIESYKLGINSYIVKPVDFDQFCESVRQIGCYWLLLNQPPTL